MAFSIGELVGFIKIDHSGVKSGMAAADREVKAGMAKTGATADQSGKDVGKRFGSGVVSSVGSSLKTFAAGVAGAFAVDKVVQFVGGTIKAASELEQSIGGVDAVFGQYADNVHEKSAQAAQDLGLSKNAYNELITVSAAMLKNKGLDDFAAQSEKLVAVGADLAAQFGGPTSQAVEALNAAMRGESDPIERYGISLNEAAVNAKMAQMGLEGLEGAALDQAKTQARLTLIQEQSADATGAFAREADTAAGKQQRLAAEWENQQAVLGEKLLPAMMAVTDFASGTLVPAFGSMVDLFAGLASAASKLPGPVKAAVAALVALHLLKGPLGGFLSGTITQVKTLGTTLKGAGIVGGAKAAGSALISAFGGPLGIAVGAAATALTFWMQEAAKTEQVADSLRGTIDKTTGAFTNQSKMAVAEALMGDLSTEDVRLVESLGFKFDHLAAAALAGGPAFDEMRKKIFAASEDAYVSRGIFDDSGQALEGLGRSFVRAGDAAERARVVGEVADKIEETGDEAKTATPKVDALAGKADELKKASEEAADKQKELAEAILEVTDAAIDADQANSDLTDAFREANKAADENGKTVNKAKTALDESTEAGKANGDALRSAAKDARDMAEANLYAGEETKKVKDRMGEAREEFIKAAEKMGLNEDAAKKLADKYGVTEGKVDDLKEAMDKIPKELVSDIKADISDAQKKIKSLQQQIDLLHGKTITITTKTGTIRASGINSQAAFGGGFREGNAMGGPIRRAGGGPISGAGTSTSDSIRAFVLGSGREYALSDGEYTVNAAAYSRNKQLVEAINAGANFVPGGGGSQQSGPLALDDTSIHKLALAMSRLHVVTDVGSLSQQLVGW